MIAIGFILSLFFSRKEQQQEHSPQREGEKKKGEEKNSRSLSLYVDERDRH